jgi:hypothetical protein
METRVSTREHREQKNENCVVAIGGGDKTGGVSSYNAGKGAGTDGRISRKTRERERECVCVCVCV